MTDSKTQAELRAKYNPDGSGLKKQQTRPSKSLFRCIAESIDRVVCLIYRMTIPSKVKRLRKKEKIVVLFFLNDISKWKSEGLYLQMLEHERFEPILGVTTGTAESPLAVARKVYEAIAYLDRKKYEYVELSERIDPQPDIVIYTEPYIFSVPIRYIIYRYFRKCLFICIHYTCHLSKSRLNYFPHVHRCAWIDCYESKLAIDEAYKIIGRKRKSLKHTGLPMADMLLSPASGDPWKPQGRKKKRIIWAPHHSMGLNGEKILYSNFLEIAEYMLALASEFEDDIQIAFKPHPVLRDKLNEIWGQKKTIGYYECWENMENGQLSEGSYADLFKHSDAMIHDCVSFIVEYQFMNKPVLFITKDIESLSVNLTEFGKKALFAQQIAHDKADIRNFIVDVIVGRDEKSAERNAFLSDELLPPNGKSASQNIIDQILVEK
jgi:hypothetical protein